MHLIDFYEYYEYNVKEIDTGKEGLKTNEET
jgi:hypothetical protein